jgi:signal transduction histidine kinase
MVAAPVLGVVGVSAMAGLALVALSVHVYRTNDEPSVTSFSALVFVAGVVGLTTAVAPALPWPYYQAAGFLTSLLPIFYSAFWLVFALTYLGYSRYTTPRSLLVIAVVFASFLVTGVVPRFADALTTVVGIYFSFGSLFVTGLSVVLVGLVVRETYNQPALSVRAGGLVAVGAMSVIFGGWVNATLLTTLEPGLTTTTAVGVGLLFVLPAVTYGLAAVRYPLFDRIPATQRVSTDRIVAEMGDLVLVVDDDEEIVELNPAAEGALYADIAGVVGTPLAEVLGYSLSDLQERDTIEIRMVDGISYFESTLSRLTDERGQLLGWTIVLHDVTERRFREQRLDVLNRVLRHNLRNDMSAVLTYSKMIKEGEQSELVADRVYEGAADVVEIGEKAREIEEMMAIDPDIEASVLLAPVVEDAVQAVVGRRDDTDVTLDVPGGLAVHGDTRLLEPIVRNLVENAVEHNDAEPPRLWVSAERGDGTVSLSVVDNGPGIPEYERRVLTEAEETKLEHGSGLGLWAVKWGLQRLGGNVAFDTRADGGSVVVLRLPSPDVAGWVGDDGTPVAGRIDGAPARVATVKATSDQSPRQHDADDGEQAVEDDRERTVGQTD